jgi:hypothetical protein
VEWNGPALDLELNTLYVNAVDWCWTFAAVENVRHIPGHNYIGGSLDSPSVPKGWVTAVDAASWGQPLNLRASDNFVDRCTGVRLAPRIEARIFTGCRSVHTALRLGSKCSVHQRAAEVMAPAPDNLSQRGSRLHLCALNVRNP